jgi:capsule polysaccharide export protein KpsE/RkpR
LQVSLQSDWEIHEVLEEMEMFNALRYIKKLESAGFNREQAEIQVQLVLESIEEEMATKTDLSEIRTEMASMKGELKTDIAEVRTEMASMKGALKSDIAEVRTEMASMKGELKADIAEVRAEMAFMKGELKTDMASLKTDLLIKMGGMFILSTTLLGFLIRWPH